MTDRRISEIYRKVTLDMLLARSPTQSNRKILPKVLVQKIWEIGGS